MGSENIKRLSPKKRFPSYSPRPSFVPAAESPPMIVLPGAATHSFIVIPASLLHIHNKITDRFKPSKELQALMPSITEENVDEKQEIGPSFSETIAILPRMLLSKKKISTLPEKKVTRANDTTQTTNGRFPVTQRVPIYLFNIKKSPLSHSATAPAPVTATATASQPMGIRSSTLNVMKEIKNLDPFKPKPNRSFLNIDTSSDSKNSPRPPPSPTVTRDTPSSHTSQSFFPNMASHPPTPLSTNKRQSTQEEEHSKNSYDSDRNDDGPLCPICSCCQPKPF